MVPFVGLTLITTFCNKRRQNSVVENVLVLVLVMAKELVVDILVVSNKAVYSLPLRKAAEAFHRGDMRLISFSNTEAV